MSLTEIQTSAMNFREGKILKGHNIMLMRLSLTLRYYCNGKSHPGTLTAHHSHQISSERVAEADGVGPCPVPVLWIALGCRAVKLASFHSTQNSFWLLGVFFC